MRKLILAAALALLLSPQSQAQVPSLLINGMAPQGANTMVGWGVDRTTIIPAAATLMAGNVPVNQAGLLAWNQQQHAAAKANGKRLFVYVALQYAPNGTISVASFTALQR